MKCRFAFWLPIALAALLFSLATAVGHCADAAAFDLAGPKVDVHVQRDGKTLPIAEVPNLLPGDRLWIHPDLPATQSARYILIVAFLRGATNPPPADWFHRVETWSREAREEGVFVVVPAEAEQALIFLAPETTGDFATLRKAVRDRPGAFVRAAQDLQQASWDRLRLDAYLAQIKKLPQGDPKLLKDGTELSARSLGIRVDQQCFDTPTEQQAPCLVQHTDGLVLDDSNAQSVVTQMVNGSAADMMNQLSYSALGGAGQFSPYVGAIVDLARILSSVHTAKYQYIPALALPQREQPDTLNLRLNVPPSFRDPKSVIVVALPPIGAGAAPLLRGAEQGPGAGAPPLYCAAKPGLILSAEGAPLVFATAMAHDLMLHVATKAAFPSDGPAHPELTPVGVAPLARAAETGIDLPVDVDPAHGGFVLKKPPPPLPETETAAELRGMWGFDVFTGPSFRLLSPHPGGWAVPATDRNALITGRDDLLHLQGESTVCIDEIHAVLQEGEGKRADIKVAWKPSKPDALELTVPLRDAAPGPVTVALRQFGMDKAEELALEAYAEAAAIDHLTLSAGDKGAVLKGKRLDEVSSADLAGIAFSPSALNRVGDSDQLAMAATGNTATLQPRSDYSAKVTLRDGRTLHVPATVQAQRPQVDLLSKGMQHDESDGSADIPPPIRLGSPNDLPLQRKLVFFLRSRVPETFPRTEKIELAAEDGSFATTLSLADGSLMLEDAHTGVAVLDPLARFGASAFGPIQLRAVDANGAAGEWVPLGILVRLPGFNSDSTSKDLRCPRNPAKPCQLAGTNLFLISAIATTPEMADAVDVPADFTGGTISVPNMARSGASLGTGTLYLRLRDDPETVQTLNLPISAPTASGSLAGADPAVSAASAAAHSDAATPAAHR